MTPLCLARRSGALAALLAVASAHAVPPGAVSWTARATCEYRALAAQHPDPKLRGGDTLAGKLCGTWRLPREYEYAREVIDDNPEAYGGFFYVSARTRHIDALVEGAEQRGIRQVVVLGAGFDSRAYRYHAAHPRLAFFEVDLPATLQAKREAITHALGGVPGYVRYVPIDFDTQTLEQALPAAGYDAKAKSLFILEGVTMYVNLAGNDATLAFIGAHSAPGSELVFDYLLRDAVEGRGPPAARAEARAVASIGEPYVTGWTPDEARAFVNRHGLDVVDDLDAAELTRRYLTGSSGKPDGVVASWVRIVDARVR